MREVNATQDVPGFIRAKANKEILEKFDTLLIDYYQSDKPQTIGLPSVAYCASELNLSANILAI